MHITRLFSSHARKIYVFPAYMGLPKFILILYIYILINDNPGLYFIIIHIVVDPMCPTLFALSNYYFQFNSSVSENPHRSGFRPSARRLRPFLKSSAAHNAVVTSTGDAAQLTTKIQFLSTTLFEIFIRLTISI